MDNKCLVRIIKSELIHFKNVEYGEIRYMNYQAVENEARITNNDIVGIYGQNGSGKTAVVEALDILKYILAGQEIPYEEYEGLLYNDGTTQIITTFFVKRDERKYKTEYIVFLQANRNEKKINLISEKLTFWQRGATWKSERYVKFNNPYYNTELIAENIPAELDSNVKNIGDMKLAYGLQNLAVYCAQKSVSLFFNSLMLTKLTDKNTSDYLEENILNTLVQDLSYFGNLNFQVVKVNQGYLPLFMNGTGMISEQLYSQLKNAIGSINIALKAIIPNLRIELRVVSEELDREGNRNILVEAYSIRDGKEFLTKYESEGIKRIISLLNYLISVYNYPEICLVVDELDSGIFEYLLGELLGVLNEEAKGQLIFTSHNLRAFEKLNIKNIICSTINPKNRYIRLVGKEKNHNPRDFYIRTITIGGQKEELYDETDLETLGYAFRRACQPKNDVKIHFSDTFKEKLKN